MRGIRENINKGFPMGNYNSIIIFKWLYLFFFFRACTNQVELMLMCFPLINTQKAHLYLFVCWCLGLSKRTKIPPTHILQIITACGIVRPDGHFYAVCIWFNALHDESNPFLQCCIQRLNRAGVACSLSDVIFLGVDMYMINKTICWRL